MAIQNIYCDSNNSVAGDGSIGNPYKALASINWTTVANWITAGDTVYINLKRGSHWRELLTVGASGATSRPIILQAYGAGAKPILNGSDLVTGWSASGAGLGSTWQATCGATAANLCMINGIYRFAGASATTLNNGEWYKSGTILYFRWDAGNPDSEGVTVELGQRSSLSNNNRAYITYDDFELRYANSSGIDNQNATPNQTFLNLLFNDCYQGLGYRGAGGVMKYCEFVGGTTHINLGSDASAVLVMSYSSCKNSYGKFITISSGSSVTIDNSTLVGSAGIGVHQTVGATTILRNSIVTGCGANSSVAPIVSTAGTFTISNSIIGQSMTGQLPTGVTYGAGVKFTTPRFKTNAYEGMLTWTCDDGDYIYTRLMGDTLRAASAAFEGATLGDYNTYSISAPKLAAMQAGVALGDEWGGHGRHSFELTVFSACKLFCSNFGTSTTVTVSVAGNVLTTKVDGVVDLNLSLTNASYDTMAELVAYINNRTGALGVVYGATIQSSLHNLVPSTVLDDIADVDIRVASPGTQISYNPTRMWDEELTGAKNDIEAAVGGGYTAPTYIYIGGNTSAAQIEYLRTHGFVGGRTASITGISTLLRNLDHWHTYGYAAPAAHGTLLHLPLSTGFTDTSGNSYTFTAVSMGAASSYLYARLPTSFANAQNFTGASYIYRASMAKLDYRNADWSFGAFIRPTRLTGAETYTIFYHGDASGTDNYTRLWISADGALHYSIVVGGVESVRLDSAAGVMVVNETKAVAVRQKMGVIELLAGAAASTGPDNNVTANILLATITTSTVPGVGNASYGGNIYIGASSDGTGGVLNNYYGYMNDAYMGQNTVQIALGLCDSLTALGQYVVFMHHADVPYDLIKTYAETVAWYNANVGTVLVKTFKSAMTYLLAHGTLTDDGLRLRYQQTDNADFQLKATSPAIDAATDLSYTLDLAGQAVPNGATPDIGAYEYYAAVTGISRTGFGFRFGGFLFGVLLLLVGCATVPEVCPVIPEVVAPCPVPPEIARPILPISQLKPEILKGLTQDQKEELLIKTGTTSLSILMQYAKDLEIIVNGYKEKKP